MLYDIGWLIPHALPLVQMKVQISPEKSSSEQVLMAFPHQQIATAYLQASGPHSVNVWLQCGLPTPAEEIPGNLGAFGQERGFSRVGMPYSTPSDAAISSRESDLSV